MVAEEYDELDGWMVATTNIDCVPGGSSSRVESQSPKDVVRVCMWDRERVNIMMCAGYTTVQWWLIVAECPIEISWTEEPTHGKSKNSKRSYKIGINFNF